MQPAAHTAWVQVDRSAPARLRVARSAGVAGLAAYNWWVVALVVPGWGPSREELFSDLEAVGQPHAALFGLLDRSAGLLVVGALLLLWRPRHQVWWLLLGFAGAATLGGIFPYQCAEGLSAACRTAELRLALPWRHYAHMVAGVIEFLCGSTALVVAARRDRYGGARAAALVRDVAALQLAAYPVLGVAYLANRFGGYVEPVFFVSFSVAVAAELFAVPDHQS